MHTNRLIHETSPYLLQHAHNPVDWRPWSSEAFAEARTRDKLIFLSIGYSTCYWCHVMERECFENEAIARLMNEHFICIKVDREERPDVDDIYMTATQLMTGSGGWPMSVFLEPQLLKPIVAGTYFPPEDRYGRPGFPTVLRQISSAWRDQREAVLQQAENVADAVKAQLTQSRQSVAVGQSQIDAAVNVLMSIYDRQHGGFGAPGGHGPKFPTPVNLNLLMQVAWDNQSVREAVLHTLDRMAIGGMYDQIGGGFHRYSTDEKWLVPHFEKMLYDNGQLASTYARALELTGDSFHARIVQGTLDYVLREMTDAGGGFYSAQDAEVDAREGGNYLWTAAEVGEVLRTAGLGDDVDFALRTYELDRGTNFQDPHHPEEPPSNVMYFIDRPDALARSMGLKLDDFTARLDRINAALLAIREQRDQPRLDDKILAGWNGLMIAGFADGGRVLNDAKYLDAGRRAARFILQSMRPESGGLLRSLRAGQARIEAFLEDYALLIRGLLSLHRATGELEWLTHARELADQARSRFWDAVSGGYFDTLADQSDLFVRVKSSYDGAIPCGNSTMVINLLDLHEATGMGEYLDDAAACLSNLSGAMAQHPNGPAVAVRALKRFVDRYPSRLPTHANATANVPVRMKVDIDEIALKLRMTAVAALTLQIDPAYHINAHEPGSEFLVPFTVELIDGDGVRMTAEYPPGVDFRGEFADDTIKAYTGDVRVPLRFERTGHIHGKPRIVVTYQACTDKACLAPVTQALPLRIAASD